MSLVQSPVLSVNVQVIVTTARVRVSHLSLQIAGVNIAHERVAAVTAERPAVVLRGPQVHTVELIDAFLAKQGEMQLAGAVFVTEEEAKRVFGIVAVATVTTAESQASINLKVRRAVGIDQLQRDGAFPGDAVVAGVRVDAGRGAQQVVDVHHDRNRRDLHQRSFELWSPGGAVDDIRVHAVVQHLPVDVRRRGETGGRGSGRRLPYDIVQEQVRRRLHVGGIEARLERAARTVDVLLIVNGPVYTVPRLAVGSVPSNV